MSFRAKRSEDPESIPRSSRGHGWSLATLDSRFGNDNGDESDHLALGHYQINKAVMKFQVVLEQGEDGYSVAHCLALRGCWSQGKTREEALANIQEAIELYLAPQ